MRILVVEDHPRLARSMADGLREEGYAVDLTFDGKEALRLAKASPYDCILLDIMLPGMDGWAVLQALRQAGRRTAVICLTARDSVQDRVHGLDLGADDYVVKPFDWKELLARVRSAIRRSHDQPSNIIEVGDLRIDLAAKSASRAGEPIDLTAREFNLLEFLARRRDAVVSREAAMSSLYDGCDEINSNVIDVYIGFLRRKIDRQHELKLIHTRRGLGYILTDTP
jgi:two-component system copper resistance phosphate regulon response regulator CusR